MPFPNSINIKIERARQHLDSFNEESSRVLGELNVNGVVREIESNSGDYVWYFRPQPNLTDNLLIFAGDFVHNLRSVLDHVVFALIDEGKQRPLSEFPIYESPGPGNDGFHGAGIPKIWTMPEEAKVLIERFQPYNAGNKPLADLRTLDNIDKHRRLLVGLYAVQSAALRGPAFRLSDPSSFTPMHLHGISFSVGRFKAGDKIARVAGTNDRAEVEKIQVKPTFQISLEEHGIDKPFAEVMNGLHDYITSKLLPEFERFF